MIRFVFPLSEVEKKKEKKRKERGKKKRKKKGKKEGKKDLLFYLYLSWMKVYVDLHIQSFVTQHSVNETKTE